MHRPPLLVACALSLSLLPQSLYAYGGGQVVSTDVTAKATLFASADFANGQESRQLGELYLRQVQGSPCATIRGTITGLKPNSLHALHVHALGDTYGGCTSAAGHYNPFNETHGAPHFATRHAGDLGNVRSDANGVARVYFADHLVKLVGPTSVLGRSMVVHVGVDDLGLGGQPDSLTTGNAGGRLMCGVIGLTSTGYPPAWARQLGAASPVRSAVAVLFEAAPFVDPGTPAKSVGVVRLRQTDQGTEVEGEVNGLTAGLHGFHVHDLGDVGDMCRQAAGHWNPGNATHGGPTSSVRHAGDLGNILADDTGVSNINMVDQQVTLAGLDTAVGRAIVVHVGEDDLGMGGNPESLKTGNAGPRYACGIVGIKEEGLSGQSY